MPPPIRWRASHGQTLFLIALAISILLVPARADAESSIATSGDVWATLVANVAPLLVLLGEKHVKGYFKTMSRPSHHMLFAVGPIGLVTALVTMIRLGNLQFLKRLIGRQFESRAEVLADVTSVSTGEVSVVFRNETLEQTIERDPPDLAIFWTIFKARGSLKEALTRFKKLCGNNARVLLESDSTFVLRLKNISFTELVNFRRFSQNPSWIEMFYLERKIQSNNLGITVDWYTYQTFTGVSLGLTASRCLLTPRNSDFARFAVSVFCVMINISIVFLNWRQQHNIQNTALISAGITISTICSFLAASHVDSCSEEREINLSEISNGEALVMVSSGFIAKDESVYTNLRFSPSHIIISTGSNIDDTHTKSNPPSALIFSYVTLLAMVLGYLSLYLGLRTSEWWASLGILGVSAIASFARTVLVPTANLQSEPRPSLKNRTRTTADLYKSPLYTYIEDLASHGTSLFPQEGMKSKQFWRKPNSKPGNLLKPFHEGKDLDYEIVCCGGKLDAGFKELRYSSLSVSEVRHIVATSLRLFTLIQKRHKVPLEFSSEDFYIHTKFHTYVGFSIPTNYTHYERRTVFSDIIFRDGIWRQPLEFSVSPYAYRPNNTRWPKFDTIAQM